MEILWPVLRTETNLVLNQLDHFLVVCFGAITESWAFQGRAEGKMEQFQGKHLLFSWLGHGRRGDGAGGCHTNEGRQEPWPALRKGYIVQ